MSIGWFQILLGSGIPVPSNALYEDDGSTLLYEDDGSTILTEDI